MGKGLAFYDSAKNTLTAPRIGEVYLSRQSESGRVKLYIEQDIGLWYGYADILYFDPADDNRLKIGQWNNHITPANYQQRMVFTKFGSVVGFTIEGTGWNSSYIKFNPTGTAVSGYGSSNLDPQNTLPYVPAFLRKDYDNNYGPSVSSPEYHNYNNIKSNGRGDICQLAGLTAAQIQGAATQAAFDALLAARGAEYKGWRLPTDRENASFVGGTSSYINWIGWQNRDEIYYYYPIGADDASTTTKWPYYYNDAGYVITNIDTGTAATPNTGRFPVVNDAYNAAYSQILPAAGFRSTNFDGATVSVGSVGRYWTSSPAGSAGYSYYLFTTCPSATPTRAPFTIPITPSGLQSVVSVQNRTELVSVHPINFIYSGGLLKPTGQ